MIEVVISVVKDMGISRSDMRLEFTRAQTTSVYIMNS